MNLFPLYENLSFQCVEFSFPIFREIFPTTSLLMQLGVGRAICGMCTLQCSFEFRVVIGFKKISFDSDFSFLIFIIYIVFSLNIKF